MELISTQPRTMPPGPFSQAFRHGDIVYVAGQVAYDGETGKPVLGDIKAQTRQTLKNLKAVLEAAGSSLDKVLKLTCILPNFPQDYVGFNEAFKEFFPGPHFPARTSIQAGLLGGFVVEIEAIAVCERK
ncbi:MAG: RidA family protein [Betaproteobacteria bacterium]|nr:MAG: RidA family protein [Betaproteobacteria bacterium]